MTEIEYTSEIKCDLIGSGGLDDLDIVHAAQVSFDKFSPVMGDREEGILKFLVKNNHGSPFEHTYFRFYIECPIFVVREHHRHRAGHSYNEMSGRYVEMEPKFYLPETARVQHGKPGGYHFTDEPAESNNTLDMRDFLADSYHNAWTTYQELLQMNVAKEQARLALPVATYTKYWWSCNARSLMHFLKLRTDPTAMKEIRTLAEQAEKAFAEKLPVTHEAWVANNKIAP